MPESKMNLPIPTFFSLNTPFGLLMGGCFIVASWLCYRQNGTIYANLTLGRIITFLYVIGLFMQMRRFRESSVQKGYISYGRALKTGVYLSLLAGLSYGIFIFYIYSADPGMLENYLTTLDGAFHELYSNTELADQMTKIVKTFTTPFSIAFSEFFSKILTGTFYTLILAAFLKKKPASTTVF